MFFRIFLIEPSNNWLQYSLGPFLKIINSNLIATWISKSYFSFMPDFLLWIHVFLWSHICFYTSHTFLISMLIDKRHDLRFPFFCNTISIDIIQNLCHKPNKDLSHPISSCKPIKHVASSVNSGSIRLFYSWFYLLTMWSMPSNNSGINFSRLSRIVDYLMINSNIPKHYHLIITGHVSHLHCHYEIWDTSCAIVLSNVGGFWMWHKTHCSIWLTI